MGIGEEMPMETKIIDITPDKSLMPKISFSGYSVVQAISELVDNSVDAKIEDQELLVEITLKPEYVVVKDNGKGMNETEASDCLILAHSTKNNQLGEFGLGLKTAAQSLGKKFTVITTKNGENKRYVLEYDDDLWNTTEKEWKHQLRIADDVTVEEHGTLVRIEKLKIKFYAQLVTILKDELGMRYAPLLEQGMLKIKVNTTFCEPHEQELTADGRTEFKIPLEAGNNIHGWVGLLKNPGGAGNKGYYGFSTFRRGRLITQYEKIGFEPHPTVRRIVGEIHMDHVPVTHNKREWIKEHSLYIEAREEMSKFLKPFLIKARKYDESSKIDNNIQEKMEQQLKNMAKAINRNAELKQYSLPKMDVEVTKGDEEKIAEEIEKREKNQEPIIQIHNEPENNKTRIPKKTHQRMTIRINGKQYRFSHKFQDLGDRDTLKLKVFDIEKGIEIFTNIGFPAFHATRDPIFYGTFNIAEAIAECMVESREESKERIYDLRNIILKETAQIMQDLEELDKYEKERKEAEKKTIELKEKIGDF